MGFRDKMRRFEQAARSHVVSFELLDGSLYYHDPLDPKLFLHWAECLRAGNPDKWPEPPEAVRKVAEVRDPWAALESIRGRGTWGTFPYDLEALANERDIRPRSLIAGRGVYDPGDRGPLRGYGVSLRKKLERLAAHTRAGGYYHVPKRDLVHVCIVACQNTTLHVAKLRYRSVLEEKLKNYRLKQNLATGYAASEPIREGQHDDLLFAVCLGVWAWERAIEKREYIAWPGQDLFENLA